LILLLIRPGIDKLYEDVAIDAESIARAFAFAIEQPSNSCNTFYFSLVFTLILGPPLLEDLFLEKYSKTIVIFKKATYTTLQH